MGTKKNPQKDSSQSAAELDTEAIGERLKSVRGRLTQAAFADLLGLERKTVSRYESGERAPDALALLRLLAGFGVDPAWLLTGEGVTSSLSDDERELLAMFQGAPLAGKMAAVGALKGVMGATSKIRKQTNITAHGGQAAGGKIVNR